ncbi:MAG: hypothetical protein J2P58_00090, partial [Acidimicrobiaceae bacterium]|nr:hypothetical protein [Acidimicrobiaceae bacterium]
MRRVTSVFRSSPPVVPVGTYTQWSWPSKDSGYDEMRWDLEPRTDPSPVGYFWSHQVALVGGEGGYLGLQTQGSEPTGKIAIFSVWGAIDADGPEYAAPFSGEGDGMTVRIRYPWAPGRRERLAIRAEDDGWWRAEVGHRQIGRVRVDPAWGGLASTSIMWTERYSPQPRDCSELGHSVAFFGTPMADRGVTPLGHRNFLADHQGCPGSSVYDS